MLINCSCWVCFGVAVAEKGGAEAYDAVGMAAGVVDDC